MLHIDKKKEMPLSYTIRDETGVRKMTNTLLSTDNKIQDLVGDYCKQGFTRGYYIGTDYKTYHLDFMDEETLNTVIKDLYKFSSTLTLCKE